MLGNLKAANFQIEKLRIGFYEIESQYPLHLEAKIYFGRKKLVWEVLRCGLKYKIEIEWSNISAIRATLKENKPGILEIELKKIPEFFHEINDQGKNSSQTKWIKSQDFTDHKEASKYRLHFLQFTCGVLNKHYNNLLECNERLRLLSKGSYPSSENGYFECDLNQGTTTIKASEQQPPQNMLPAPMMLSDVANAQPISGNNIPMDETINDRMFVDSSLASWSQLPSSGSNNLSMTEHMPCAIDVQHNELDKAITRQMLQDLRLTASLNQAFHSHHLGPMESGLNYEPLLPSHSNIGFDFSNVILR